MPHIARKEYMLHVLQMVLRMVYLVNPRKAMHGVGGKQKNTCAGHKGEGQ